MALALYLLGTQVASPHTPAAAALDAPKSAAASLPALPLALDQPELKFAPAALFELTLAYPDDGDLAGLLVQAGALPDKAKLAADLLRASLGSKVDGDIKLALGETLGGKGRSIELLTILHDLGRTVVSRDGATLRLVRDAPQTIHISVPNGDDNALQSLRSAGLDPRLALEAAAIIERRAADARRVTAVYAERPDRFGGPGTPRLLYLGIARNGRKPLQLLYWPGTSDGWIDVDKFMPDARFMPPVEGRVTSRFGSRFHPILHLFRPHQGIDFAGRWGEPVRAAADGRVVAAGWSGGYGRQVRLDHGSAMATSYSHLSNMVAASGQWVRQGQIIGYVGASGLATGPHLHFEIMRSGHRVDPLNTRIVGAGNSADRAAVAARLAQLNIPVTKPS